MTSLGELPTTTASPLPNLNASYDPDVDPFLNLDQLSHPSSESMKSNPSLPSESSMTGTEASVNDSFLVRQSQQNPFSGPSHQYGDHQQQTGFPPGAVAFAFNDTPTAFGAGHQGFDMTDDLLGSPNMKQEDTPFDFGTAPSRNPSEMDVEADNFGGLPAYMFSASYANKQQQFINPTALAGHESSPATGQPAPVGRMYPGMHQQQAAMARAAQQQKQQTEMIRQQLLQQRQAEDQARKAATRPPPPPAPIQHQTRAVRSTDPLVEERISRLLQQMRQNSSQDPSASTPSSLPHMARPKKDEDDMDEDERLLASEEGKKLTSKERRQLRNKVSARAFRSRRKEYITQLESEISAKTSEANELHVQNRALLEENGRLTDLTRMLLSSSHFSNFLNDITVNGLPPQLQNTPQPTAPVMSHTPAPQSNPPRNMNSHGNAQDFQGSQPQDFQVGMVMVPEYGTDMHASGWNSGIDMNFTHAPVFAVLEVPEGPAVDTDLLSGKTSHLVEFPSVVNTKDALPCLERPPVLETQPTISNRVVADSKYEIDESDPAFALFLDEVPAISTTSCDVSDNLFGGIESGKLFAHYELVVDDASIETSATSSYRFERLSSSMEAAFQRVSTVTSHLL